MKHTALMQWSVRVGIIVFWIMVIVGFLYAGTFFNLFNTRKTINVLAWGQVLDTEYLSDFEKETGIHVNISYFENNEEVFVKLRATDEHDYDVIMPSDWAVELLIQEGRIKKIDRTRLTMWDTLYPTLCHLYCDPYNDYSIPFYWSLFGLGIDRTYFNGVKPPATWGLVFDEAIMPDRIAMVEDPRPLIFIAALYLFGRVEQLNDQEIQRITDLLIRQKKHVEIYTDTRPEYVLASGVVPVAVGLSGDLLKVMRRFNTIDFVVPQEGGFAEIVSFAITSVTQKDDLIYPFLNYIFRKDVVKKYVDKFDFFPAVNIDVEYDDRFVQFTKPTKKIFDTMHFFKNVIPRDVFNTVLIALKS
jgi:spermidine/putrescine transport system substrate-binding protein